MNETERVRTGSTRSVVVVEDEDHIATLIEFVLKRDGFEVTVLRDGLEAEEHIGMNQPPALVILDVMLPYKDGFQLVERIRRDGRWRDVPILMLTSQSSEESIVRALNEGANDYVLKPFKVNELKARARKLVDT